MKVNRKILNCKKLNLGLVLLASCLITACGGGFQTQGQSSTKRLEQGEPHEDEIKIPLEEELEVEIPDELDPVVEVPAEPEPSEPTPPVEPEPPVQPPVAGENAWIKTNFAAVTVYKGDFSKRTAVESPALIKDATACCGKYAFAPQESAGADDKRVAFTNVTIKNLTSTDAYGAGIGTSRSYPGMKVFVSKVYIEPNWPVWKNYTDTNYDGIVLDGSIEFYAEDLTIKNWNADSALDIKSDVAQFVRLKTEGKGHRTLRFWETGPHYIVDSDVNNTGEVGEGSLIWMADCANTKINVYGSRFNGQSTIPANKIKCDSGSNPKIIYLNDDPRKTGEMHPMFVK